METTTLLFVILGIFIGYLIIAIPKSFFVPETRKMYAVMFFGKFWKIIENVEGKKLYKGESINGGLTKWDLIDLAPGETKEKINVYFILWPFFKLYTYPLTYVKLKKMGEEREGDIIVHTDEKTKEIWVSRSGISNYLEFREDYPTVSTNIDTEELASVITYTNNMLEITNPWLAFFSIKNWFIASTEILSGAQRGLVAMKKIYALNQFSSEGGAEAFSEKMKESVNKKDLIHPGLGNFGIKLFKSVFKDFDPADSKAKELMDSYAQVTIADEIGKAKVKTAQKDAEVVRELAKGDADGLRTKSLGEADALRTKAKGEADAYETNQKKIVLWRKKYLIDTGLAKVDTKGDIVELIPEANIKIGADAIKELASLTGTLVLDSGSLNKIFSINSTKQEGKNE